MDRETILRIAKECGIWIDDCSGDLERFAHRMMAEGVKMAADRYKTSDCIQTTYSNVEYQLRRLAKQLEKGEQ